LGEQESYYIVPGPLSVRQWPPATLLLGFVVDMSDKPKTTWPKISMNDENDMCNLDDS